MGKSPQGLIHAVVSEVLNIADNFQPVPEPGPVSGRPEIQARTRQAVAHLGCLVNIEELGS